jgi:hypothetical protein
MRRTVCARTQFLRDHQDAALRRGRDARDGAVLPILPLNESSRGASSRTEARFRQGSPRTDIVLHAHAVRRKTPADCAALIAGLALDGLADTRGETRRDSPGKRTARRRGRKPLRPLRHFGRSAATRRIRESLHGRGARTSSAAERRPPFASRGVHSPSSRLAEDNQEAVVHRMARRLSVDSKARVRRRSPKLEPRALANLLARSSRPRARVERWRDFSRGGASAARWQFGLGRIGGWDLATQGIEPDFDGSDLAIAQVHSKLVLCHHADRLF